MCGHALIKCYLYLMVKFLYPWSLQYGPIGGSSNWVDKSKWCRLASLELFCVYDHFTWIQTNLQNGTLHNVTPSLISPNHREWMCLVEISLRLCHIPFHISRLLTLKQSTKGFEPCALHASHCHCHGHRYCNVDFVLFHNVTCYTIM